MPTSAASPYRTKLPSLDHLPKLPVNPYGPAPGPKGVVVHSKPLVDLRSRRGLLGGLLTSSGRSQLTPGVSGPPKDPVLALVHRITQGFQRSEYQRARRMGYDAYLEEQLDHLSIDDSAMDARLANFPTLSQSPKQLVDLYPDNSQIPFLELKSAMVVRSVHSKRQLFERMCEFWTDHFNIDHQKDPEWAFKSEDDREVIRKQALGTFPDLLRASVHSGAMMFYLDNWLNFAGLPQENYARELMELHTLGVGGGYTELDVKEVAKCLTGWSLNFDENSPDYLRFEFIRAAHQTGAKTVLGNLIPAFSYQQGGEMVIDILASHASTARFIAGKMTRWLLSEDPPQAVVDEVTQTYLSTNGDIKAMIRVILREEHVTQGSTVYQPKFRRPFHFVTSLLRGLEADVYDALAPTFYLATMGNAPFDWHAPTGYPDAVNDWGALQLPRWTFAAHVMLNYVPGVHISLGKVIALLNGLEKKGLARRIDHRILGGTLSPTEVKTLQGFIDIRTPLLWPDVYEAIGLAASLPGPQWY